MFGGCSGHGLFGRTGSKLLPTALTSPPVLGMCVLNYLCIKIDHTKIVCVYNFIYTSLGVRYKILPIPAIAIPISCCTSQAPVMQGVMICAELDSEGVENI